MMRKQLLGSCTLALAIGLSACSDDVANKSKTAESNNADENTSSANNSKPEEVRVCDIQDQACDVRVDCAITDAVNRYNNCDGPGVYLPELIECHEAELVEIEKLQRESEEALLSVFAIVDGNDFDVENLCLDNERSFFLIQPKDAFSIDYKGDKAVGVLPGSTVYYRFCNETGSSSELNVQFSTVLETGADRVESEILSDVREVESEECLDYQIKVGVGSVEILD